jgi:hypothetical protein
MNYDEQTAKGIIEKYSLAKNVLYVWKTRGVIPDKYFKDDFEPKKKKVVVIPDATKAYKVFTERIIDVLKMREINTSTFSELTGINLLDICKGNRRLSEDEIIIVKKEINRLKVDITKTVASNISQSIIKLLNDERIKPYVLIKNMQASEIKRILYNKSMDRRQSDIIKDAFIKLALQLNL